MDQLFASLSDPMLAGFLAASVRLAIPIMLAALGGMFAERSGVLNIGLEGMMLTGAFIGFVVAYATGNLWLGVAAASLAGALTGLLLGLYAILLRANQVVVGIALNLLAVGVTSFFYRLFFGTGTARPRVDGFTPVDFGALSNVPLVGPLLFQHDILAYLALGLVVVGWVVVSKSTFGLEIRSVGEHPRAAETLGIDVFRTRFLCMAASGALAGLGGAYLSLAATGVFLDNMTAGRGYIALAILILGRRQAFGILAAALLFGAAEALQLRAQLLPIGVPLQFLLMLPYVLTIVVLAGFVRRSEAPAALGIPFRRTGEEK